MNTIVSLALLFVLSVYGAQGLSCYCRMARCENIESLKRRCKGGLVNDVCHCCKTCAKVEGETCGGLWGLDGTCDQSLFCKGSDRLYMMTRGICAQQTPSTRVTDFPTSWQNILKTTETSYSGDESGDNSESSGEVTEEPTLVSEWSWLITSTEPEPTQETSELPTFDPSEEEEENENMVIF